MKLLENPRLWDECQQTSPETAEALRVVLSIMSGQAQLDSYHHLPLPVHCVKLGDVLSVDFWKNMYMPAASTERLWHDRRCIRQRAAAVWLRLSLVS